MSNLERSRLSPGWVLDAGSFKLDTSIDEFLQSMELLYLLPAKQSPFRKHHGLYYNQHLCEKDTDISVYTSTCKHS